MRATEASRDNRPLIARILELRREKAALLGFANFADLVLEDRMAHTGARALAFPGRPARPRPSAASARRTRSCWSSAARSKARTRPELEPWDVAYYAEKQRAALYDFDEEALRPYFPLERVVAGLFDLVHRLYGIRVDRGSRRAGLGPAGRATTTSATRTARSWAASTPTGIPRENKRGGAWMDALITGGPSADGFRPHLGLICGNLTPPVGGKPALLTHREVETIFHEFGHLLHHLLSRVEIRSPGRHQRGLGFRRAALADHGELVLGARGAGPVRAPLRDRRADPRRPVPEDEARAHLPRRQRADAAARLRLRRPAAAHALRRRSATATRWPTRARMLQEFSPAPLPPEHAMIAAFTHLFASPVGYGAGYYSYKWAEVLDADAFTRFRDERHLQPRDRRRVPREHSVQGRQRRPGRAVPALHGPRSRPRRAAGALRPGRVGLLACPRAEGARPDYRPIAEPVRQNVRQPGETNLVLCRGDVVGHPAVGDHLRVRIVQRIGRPRIAVARLARPSRG